MRPAERILIIGPSSLSSAVARALPDCQRDSTEALLSGVWSAGLQRFDAIVLSLAKGHAALRAIRALREVTPPSRIIVACTPAQEPQARDALHAGADDYILEPVTADDLVAALALPSDGPPVADDAGRPTVHEITQLADVLRNLRAGLPPTLNRLALLIRRAFGALFVTIEVDDQVAVSGTPGPLVLEEPLRAHDAAFGRVALGARMGPPYAAVDAARLSDYARLTETIVLQLREQSRWQELAWHDDLSELHNRRYFDTTLDELIERAAAGRRRITVALFDIDGFKSYNDRYGHDTGDALICEVAALLTRCSREHDVVARYGGDEFAVILWDAEPPRVPGSQHPTQAVALVERFQAVIREHAFQCLGPDAPGPVTLSGGMACFPWDGNTRAELLKAADEALLASKRCGKNRITLAGNAAPQADSESPPDD